MKKYPLLLSLFCLFLVACSPAQNVAERYQHTLPSRNRIDDTLSGSASAENTYTQLISPLISFAEGPYNASGYDKEGYDTSGYNEYGYDRWGYDKDVGYKRWGSNYGWGEELYYDYTGWGLPPHQEQHYLLQRTGDSTLADRANSLPVYTNDPYRDIQLLELQKADKDVASYRCFYCEADGNVVDYVGEDKNFIFIDLFLVLAVPKSSLPAYIPLQSVGIQSFDGIVGYTDGYLVFFPFKFPVDEATFKTVLAGTFSGGGFRRPRFQNADEVIDRYLGDDKDWVYYWTPGNVVSINRVKKAVLENLVSASLDQAYYDQTFRNEKHYFSTFTKLSSPRGDPSYGVYREPYYLQQTLVPLIIQIASCNGGIKVITHLG